MSLSARDKKIVLVLLPLALIGAFAFLVVKPKRQEAVKAATALEEQRERRDQAVGREQELRVAKQTFTTDYTTLVRLGKAVPTDVDMPSVLVQLERAASGTKIDFGKIAVGPRVPAAPGSAPPAGGAGSTPSAQPVAAGGAPAQSGAGQATESANSAAASSNQSTAAGQGASSGGGAASTGGSAPAASGEGPAPTPGLDTVPLELSFTGSFFDLADMFHDLKRFVSVANDQLNIRGRLMTIDAFNFKSDQSFPSIEAEIKARVFLAPADQGGTAGASPTGPSTTAGSAPTTAGTGSPPTAAASAPATP